MREFDRGRPCAASDGFSLYASVRLPAGATERLEELRRYTARPPIVPERLSLTPDGRVLYWCKRAFRDRSSHVLLDLLTFITWLAALVPRPRAHLVIYHGVFAPAAPWRDRVVPPPPDDVASSVVPGPPYPTCAHAPRPKAATRKPPARKRHRYSWAELLRRRKRPVDPSGNEFGRREHGRHSEDKWRDLIAAQERSWLGVRKFAESRGLAPATMYWWRCRLRDRSTSLVPGSVVAHDVEITKPQAKAEFELAIDSLTLRIPPGFDEGELRRLVRALRC